MDLKKEYDINDEIDLTLKTLGVEKLFETLMNGSVHKDYIEETNIITSKILEYLDRYEIMRSIIIIDSSIKFFDFKPLVDDERVIIFDTNIQFNQSSNNLVVFGDSVTSYNLNLITDKIEFLWPTEIVRDSLISLLQVYIHMILNDEISNLNYPSDNLICLYIIVRNILGMEISDIRYGSIRFEDDKLKSFIDNNLV